MQHGEYISYHQNGEILLKGYFEDGKQHGIWTEFHEDGSLYWNLRYINGVAEDGILGCFIQMDLWNLKSHMEMVNQLPIGYILMRMAKRKV